MAQNGGKMGQNGAKLAQNRAKMGRNDAKMAQNGAKMAQDVSKMAQNRAKMLQKGAKLAQNCVKKATSNSSCFGRRFFVEFALLWYTPEPRNCSSRIGGVHISQFSLSLLQSIIFASFAFTLRSLWDHFGVIFGI